VVPELAFDTGLGELFVVRVAGNVANSSSIASIEYAVAHLGTKLFVVLGHQSCGAVTAAVAGGDNGYNLNHLLSHITPAIAASKEGATVNDVTKQYGTGGLSQGKKYLLSATWNAPKEAFNDGDQVLFEGKSDDDALINLSANYKFCGYEVLEGFHLHNVLKDPQVESDIKVLKAKLVGLL